MWHDRCRRTPRVPNARGVRRRHFSSGASRRFLATKGRFAVDTKLPIPFDGAGSLENDLLCADARVAVELDGAQHLAHRIAYRRDRRKDQLLQESGYLVLRFLAEDLGRDLDAVLDAILRAMSHRASSGSAAPLHFIRWGEPEESVRARALRKMSYSTTYPSARALSRTLSSRVTIVTTCGASPSRSAVARCTASSVRIGSTGNGRRTRSRTSRSTSRMKQRRSNVRRARMAACSSAGVSRPAARARMIARPASATSSADVTCCVPAGAFRAAGSCSSNAATSALDSM